MRVSQQTGRYPVFQMLTDDTVLSGVGLIYANEVLWRMKVNPERRFRSFTKSEVETLASELFMVLQEAVMDRGATPLLDGEGGEYRAKMHAARTGAVCPRDGSTLVGTVLNGSLAAFCPDCQRRSQTPP